MKGLSMTELVAAPLLAAARAQEELSRTTVDYIRSFSKEGRMDSFSMEIGGDGGKLSLSVPLLALASIPAMAVDEVLIDFQMEVSSSQKSTEDGTVEMEGKVSSSASNTRSSNQSAKYQIHVAARKEEKSEAMSRILDPMAENLQLTRKTTTKQEVIEIEEKTSVDNNSSDGAGPGAASCDTDSNEEQQ